MTDPSVRVRLLDVLSRHQHAVPIWQSQQATAASLTALLAGIDWATAEDKRAALNELRGLNHGAM